MSLFAHYPAKSADVRSQGRALLGASRAVRTVGASVSGRTAAAASQVAGVLDSPVSALDRPIVRDADQLSVAGVVAGGALGLFATAVDGYNAGVDELNRIYERARAADFFAAPVAEDETGADGKPLSDAERKDEFDRRVADAKSALVAMLRGRESALMRALDDAADRVAAWLSGGTDPGASVSLAAGVALGLFSGSGDDSDDDDDDDDGGLFGDAFGLVEDGASGIADGVSAASDLAGAVGDEVADRGSTWAAYAAMTANRRLENPGQTIFDTLTGTAALEDLSAAEGILVEDGELYTDGEYCGEDAACLTGVTPLPTADATTSGHTIRFESEYAPDQDLVEHEMQHVYDIEDVGGAGFYGTYAADYVARLARGASREEAYENNPWEQRGDYVQENYEKVDPQGIFSGD